MIGRALAQEIKSNLHKANIKIGDLCHSLKTENVLAVLAEDLSEMRSRRLAAARVVEEKLRAANEAIHQYLFYDPLWICDSDWKMIDFRPGTPEGITHLEDSALLSISMILQPNERARVESLAVAVKRIRLAGEFLERQGRSKTANLVAREDVKEAFELILAEDTARKLA